MSKSPEESLQRDVIAVARTYGWKVHHSRKARIQRSDGSVEYRTAISGDKGYVDLTLAKRGTVLHVELKSERGRLTAEQIEWQAAIGETHRVWRPSDWPVIVEILSGGQAVSGTVRRSNG